MIFVKLQRCADEVSFPLRDERRRAGRRRAKVWAFTDLPDEINADQTLLNFSFKRGAAGRQLAVLTLSSLSLLDGENPHWKCLLVDEACGYLEGACTKPLLLLPVIFIFAAFPRRASCSFNVPPCLRVLSFPTASLPFFFPRFKPSVLLRGVSQKLKSSFQAPSFCHLHFSTGKMNIGGTKRGEERLQRRLLRARELVLLFLLHISHHSLSLRGC